jgi:hypothetical protein
VILVARCLFFVMFDLCLSPDPLINIWVRMTKVDRVELVEGAAASSTLASTPTLRHPPLQAAMRISGCVPLDTQRCEFIPPAVSSLSLPCSRRSSDENLCTYFCEICSPLTPIDLLVLGCNFSLFLVVQVFYGRR